LLSGEPDKRRGREDFEDEDELRKIEREGEETMIDV
jgi:hypothetical protein